MDYNNYYPVTQVPGHPSPPVTNNQQLGGQQMRHQHPSNGGQMMHSPLPPPQNIRQQAMPTGPPSHHQHHHQHQQQQMQHQQHPQQHLGHHSQQMPPQQQQQQHLHHHPSYHQIQSSHQLHGPSMSHSGSSQPQQQHLNHRPALNGQPQQQQQQQPQPQQQHMHPQSPHHHGSSMHIQQQKQQQLNQMVRQPLGPSVMNHTQSSGLQQPSIHHHESYFSSGPVPQSTNVHHYPQKNQQHTHQHQPQPHQQQQQQHHHNHNHHQQQQHHQHQSQVMHHHAQPSASHHPQPIQPAIGRNSPHHPSILQTEFRIIELNRRLQCRPMPTKPASPLPSSSNNEESLWWEGFASEFFEDDATLTLRIQEDKPVEYTICRTLIPRFFRKYFDDGVTDLSINLRNPKEASTQPQLITLDCDQAFIITNNIFECSSGMPRNLGLVVHTEGRLILDFVCNSYDTLSIKSWKFYTKGCREYIDRSITTMGLPKSYLAEQTMANKQGFSKSIIFYLKMCMIMEPMQEIMFQHRLTKMDPKSCLRKYLFDKYDYRSSEDNRAAPNKRRKRKPAAGSATTGASKAKKSKASVNNSICNSSSNNNNTNSNNGKITNNNGNNTNNISGLSNNITSNLNNNIMVSPSSVPSFPSAAQDVVAAPEQIQTEEPPPSQTAIAVDQIEIKGQDQDAPQVPQHPVVASEQISVEPVVEEVDEEPKIVEIKQELETIIEEQQPSSKIDLVCEMAISSNADVEEVVQVQQDIVEHESQPQEEEKVQSQDETESVLQKEEDHLTVIEEKPQAPGVDEPPIQASEEPVIEKENNNSLALTDETQVVNSTVTQKENHSNIMNSIPEDREDTCRSTSCDSIVSKLPPSSNNKNALTSNGTSNKQNRRRSSERKETLREGLMRTSDFVVAMKDLKCEHPALWRITTGNNLLQQFEPKTQNGIVLYENTNQYAGWNPEIKKDYVGVDVKLTQHTRNQITVERLLLNFQKLEDAEAFYDKHFVIYLQIVISTALDPKFWESIENEPKHHDYFLTSRRIVDDITKRFKNRLSSKLKLSEATVKNVEKYPNLLIKTINKDEKDQLCRACNTSLSTHLVAFGNRSYDMHSYKPVKVTNELSRSEDKDVNNIQLCGTCLDIVELYSEIHHMGWKLYNLAREKVELHRTVGKPINAILDECLKDENWLATIYAERDSLWSKADERTGGHEWRASSCEVLANRSVMAKLM